METQGNECGICSISFDKIPTRDVCVDHDHTQGHIRSALCRNCNGIEGKIHNLARRGARGRGATDFLQRIQAYWERFAQTTDKSIYHPSHKSDDEKRLARNKKARLNRAKAKALQNVKGK